MAAEKHIDYRPEDWRQSARNLGLDPQEVKSVSSRYDMYKRFTDQQDGAETLDLTRWYKWYRVEKLSEGHAMTVPPVRGCSITAEADAQSLPLAPGSVISEAAFLALLQAYRATRRPG